jgi:hypothetical protein
MNAVVVQVVLLGWMEGLSMDEYGVPPRDTNIRYLVNPAAPVTVDEMWSAVYRGLCPR